MVKNTHRSKQRTPSLVPSTHVGEDHNHLQLSCQREAVPSPFTSTCIRGRISLSSGIFQINKNKFMKCSRHKQACTIFLGIWCSIYPIMKIDVNFFPSLSSSSPSWSGSLHKQTPGLVFWLKCQHQPHACPWIPFYYYYIFSLLWEHMPVYGWMHACVHGKSRQLAGVTSLLRHELMSSALAPGSFTN